MDSYIRVPGFVLCPYVVGSNKHDCSRRTRLCGDFCHCWNLKVIVKAETLNSTPGQDLSDQYRCRSPSVVELECRN